MEKVGQIYKSNKTSEYYKIKEIKNNMIYYFFKNENNEKWFETKTTYVPVGYFEKKYFGLFDLIEDVKEEIIIPVSRLSKIE